MRQASLRLLSLYGLPQLQSLPLLAGLVHLNRLETGSMMPLSWLGPLLEAVPGGLVAYRGSRSVE